VNAAIMQKVEEVLTKDQRETYHAQRGAPFDLSTLRVGPVDSRPSDLRIVAGAFGLGGQRSDPSFNTTVARPAYANAMKSPRVLFEEPHQNFPTGGGRYKPFADLIANDGYVVSPNRENFAREVLQKGDILVIANALGAEAMGAPDASSAAFTDAECDAVR